MGPLGVTDLTPLPQFIEVRAPSPVLRTAYLETIPDGQELFVERLVERGRGWQCGNHAYAVSNEHKLVEFYVSPDHMLEVDILYESALVAAGADGAIVKSFDRLMLEAATRRAGSIEELGLLFRRRVNPAVSDCPGVSFREGRETDIATILSQDDGFFDGAEELHHYIRHEGLFIAEQQRRMVGCGLAFGVVAGRPDVDVGMWVVPQERGRGFSAPIVSYVVRRQLALDRRPIAGCDVSNIASCKALERVGFRADHRLLAIGYKST